jgi:hypothetical protein
VEERRNGVEVYGVESLRYIEREKKIVKGNQTGSACGCQ